MVQILHLKKGKLDFGDFGSSLKPNLSLNLLKTLARDKQEFPDSFYSLVACGGGGGGAREGGGSGVMTASLQHRGSG